MQNGFKAWMGKGSSLLLAMLLVFGLVACGGKTPDPAPASTPAVSTPQPEPEPEPTFDVTTSAFLTGEEKTADYPEGQRIVAVMVNNVIGSRPTSGLSAAKILVEIKVEGGITRFMAIFDDYSNMPEVGGVRSARDQHLQLVVPFQPFYVHEGPGSRTVPVTQMITDYDLWDFDIDVGQNASSFYRRNRPGMKTEYTRFMLENGVQTAIENKNLEWNRTYNSPMFSFVPYTDPYRVPDEGSANEVAVIHSDSYRSFFEYDASRGVYDMSQRASGGGIAAVVDENNGEQLSFQNVLVLFAGMRLYNASELVKVDYLSGGAGYLFTQGGWETVYWQKGGPGDALRLYALRDTDRELQLNPGTTYLAVVDDNQLERFDEILRAGTASQEAGGGTDDGAADTDD